MSTRSRRRAGPGDGEREHQVDHPEVKSMKNTKPLASEKSITTGFRIVRGLTMFILLYVIAQKASSGGASLSTSEHEKLVQYLRDTRPYPVNGPAELSSLSSPSSASSSSSSGSPTRIRFPSLSSNGNAKGETRGSAIESQTNISGKSKKEQNSLPTPSLSSRAQGDCVESWSLGKKASFVEYHTECGSMLSKGVVVGQTWGRLSSSRYGEWTERRCDQYARWHQKDQGATKWGDGELLQTQKSDKKTCCATCKASAECGEWAMHKGTCYQRNRNYTPVGQSSFRFPCREYVMLDCTVKTADDDPEERGARVFDGVYLDLNQHYMRKSTHSDNGGLIWHVDEYSPGSQNEKMWNLTLQLQLLPSMHFWTNDDGFTFNGGYIGDSSGTMLHCLENNQELKCNGPRLIEKDAKRMPKVQSPSAEMQPSFQSSCTGYSPGETNEDNLQKALESIGYDASMIRMVDFHPGWNAPRCDGGGAKSALHVLLPGTLRSFEHLIEYLKQWTSGSNQDCVFVALAVDPMVDISGDNAVKDWVKGNPTYAWRMLSHAQRVMDGRLAYLTFDRNDWNCVGGPRCQRYAIPIALEVLKWGLCHNGRPLQDQDVIVKSRPDLHIRETLDMAPLSKYVTEHSNTIFWMRKFKNRWSSVDDPTDQLIVGGSQGMVAWIDYFSYTLRECKVVRSNWIGIPGVSHRLIEPSRLHFCMVRHTGIMDDSTKSCNTQPYPGFHPRINASKAEGPFGSTDITTGLVCFTKIEGGIPPSGTSRESLMWPAITGGPVCEHSGPYPWNDKEIGKYSKEECSIGVI